MKILLHICCAPCAIYPLEKLRREGHDVTGIFFNPNIHPYQEYKKRKDETIAYAQREGMKLICFDDYPLEEFLRGIVFRETDRCRYCYFTRLNRTAHIARRGKFDAFTTTLLYSKFQDHEMIIDIAQSEGRSQGVAFHYEDFRAGWKEGIIESKERGMYRQQYCGCIYSEKERFYKGPPSSLSH